MTENRTLDEALMYNTFGFLIEKGMPILETIKTTASHHKEFSKGLVKVHDAVRNGDSLYRPMTLEGDLFDPLARQLILIGEESGSLDTTLYFARDLLERKDRLKTPNNNGELNKICFYRSLGTLLEGGLPMLRSLSIVDSLDNYLPKNISSEICRDVEGDLPLPKAMYKHAEYFEPFENFNAAKVMGAKVLGEIFLETAKKLDQRYDKAHQR